MPQHDAVSRLMAMKPPADFADFPAFWQRYQAQLSLVLGFNYVQATGVMTVPDSTDLESRPAEPLGDIVQYIGADGVGTDTRLLPISKVGNLGVVIEPSPLSAADVGSDVTITIAGFDAVFDTGTVAVSGSSITGLSFTTFYYVYLTNFNRATGAYTAALATTQAKNMQAVGSFYIGSITTPANGSNSTSGGGGGGYVQPGSDIEP